MPKLKNSFMRSASAKRLRLYQEKLKKEKEKNKKTFCDTPVVSESRSLEETKSPSQSVCFPTNLFYTAPKNVSETVGLFDVSDEDDYILALSDNDDDDDGKENYKCNSPNEENVASANATCNNI